MSVVVRNKSFRLSDVVHSPKNSQGLSVLERLFERHSGSVVTAICVLDAKLLRVRELHSRHCVGAMLLALASWRKAWLRNFVGWAFWNLRTNAAVVGKVFTQAFYIAVVDCSPCVVEILHVLEEEFLAGVRSVFDTHVDILAPCCRR